jgi:hypothetical protein
MKERRDKFSRGELRSLLCASTCHFTAEDNASLAELAIIEQENRDPDGTSNNHVEVFNISFGFILICRFEEPGPLGGEELEQVQMMGLSDALLKLIQYARTKGYHGLWFDNVFDELDNFETFEW